MVDWEGKLVKECYTGEKEEKRRRSVIFTGRAFSKEEAFFDVE